MGHRQRLPEFEPATYDAWRALAERDLQGAPFEKKLVRRVAGIDVQPLYTSADTHARGEDGAGLPGLPPYTRGGTATGPTVAGWDLRYELASGEPEQAAQAIAESLRGGATSIALQFDRAARAATREHGHEGLAIENLAELDALLADVPLAETPITLDAGASGLAFAAGLVALAERRKLDLSQLRGSFGLDPLTTLACYGALPTPVETALAEAGEAAAWCRRHAPQMRALTVDGSAYHDAGADAVLEIAVALAQGIEYLRALLRAGLDVDGAAEQLLFRCSVGRDFFLELAKLRALRRTWARVVEAAGGSARSQRLLLHARTSRRTKTQRDPWVNLLRGTAESFAAALGGADAISTESFGAALGRHDPFGERMARNCQHLLRHEAQLAHVIDPAGGSWYLEKLSEELAQRAWARMQSIERAGGLGRAIIDGSLQQELKSLLEAERKAVQTRRTTITGVNEYPNVHEPSPTPDPTEAARRARAAERAEGAAERSTGALSNLDASAGLRFASAIESAARGAAFAALRAALSGGAPARAVPLVRERLAEPFERLRDRADRATEQRGKRPSVLLANLGALPEHKARANFAQNLLEAGGLNSLHSAGLSTAEEAAAAFRSSAAEFAAICGSDASYASLAEPVARALQQAGARAILLAGNPGTDEARYRAAGITDFIYLGSNAVETLRALLERAGA